MKYSSRFFLYAPLALFLALAVGAGVVWWRAADALSARLDALNGHDAMPGVTLRFSSKSIGGFPFNLDVVFQDFSVTVATPHGPSAWHTDKFALHALTYGREQMIFEAAGHQSLIWTDLKGGAHALPFEAGELHASSIEGEHGLTRFDLDCIGFGSPALTAARVQLHARVAPGEKAVDLFVTADGTHLSPPLASLFGADVTRVRLNASALPSSPFNGLRNGRTDWVSAAETWRKAGGAIRVDDLEIAWHQMSVMGKGVLALDGAHTVQGALDFRVAGMQTLLDMVARRHVRGGENAGLAAALLDRAAKAGNNEAGMLGAVVGFHGGVVSVGDESATTEEVLY
ncbi:MAG TPA: DUF2125 domain-containing protein [Rhizomicrobium sp.]|jgi:hypothetical protein|nr:DUF2125 domain-containing protein [Rhizomicrobium sp.]